MKNKQQFKVALAVSLLTIAGITACDGDQKDHDHEQELITTVTITLTPEIGSPLTVTWKDLDGDGGNAPVIGSLALSAGVVYNGTISLLNESESPAENIIEEVSEEKEEHQFFYTFSPASLCTVDNLDKDANNLPVGLTFRFTAGTGSPSGGTLNVKLGHYDDGSKDGTTLSDENDINIDFPVTVTSGS